MTVNKLMLPILALLIFFGTIGVAQATGYWVVSGRQMFEDGTILSGADVRGWMTLQQVADGVGLDVADLYGRLGLPDSIAADTALKDLEGIIPDFEVTTVRDAVDIYLGLAEPVSADQASVEGTAVPSETPIPTPTPEPATPQTPVAESTPIHVPLADGGGDGLGTGPTPLPPGETLAAVDIKGRSTLQEIVDQAHVPADALLAALGLPPDTDMHTALKDLAADGRIVEVDAVRTAVAELQAP